MQILVSVNLGLKLSCALFLRDETCRQNKCTENERGAPGGGWHLLHPTESGKGEGVRWVAISIATRGREGARAGSVGTTNYK